jgi:hypothetical protein
MEGEREKCCVYSTHRSVVKQGPGGIFIPGTHTHKTTHSIHNEKCVHSPRSTTVEDIAPSRDMYVMFTRSCCGVFSKTFQFACERTRTLPHANVN